MYKLGKHRGDALVSSLIAAMITAVVGLGISHSIGVGFQGQAKIEKSIQASTFGDVRINVLKHTKYSDLAGHGKTEIANTSNPKYYDEVILGDEVVNGPANSQGRWVTIKIYEEGVQDAIGTYRYFCLKGKTSLSGVPVGTIISWGGKVGTPGEEWLLCDGSSFSSSKYPDLVNILGGAVLPNLNDGRFLEGNKTDYGTSIEAGLPNITGIMDNRNERDCIEPLSYADDISFTGAIYGISVTESYNTSIVQNTSGNWGIRAWGFDASKSNPIYGASTTVQPKAYRVRYYIKAL